MSNGTRSKTAAKAVHGRQLDDDDEESFSSNPTAFTKDSELSSKELQPKILHGSTILDHPFGPLYPIPPSIKSLQISVFQTGITNISNRIFRNAGDISIWFDEFLAQALLINMHEYFAGQVNFILHPACDAMHHIKFSTSTSPFQMKAVDDNIAFLECTSPTSIGGTFVFTLFFRY